MTSVTWEDDYKVACLPRPGPMEFPENLHVSLADAVSALHEDQEDADSNCSPVEQIRQCHSEERLPIDVSALQIHPVATFNGGEYRGNISSPDRGGKHSVRRSIPLQGRAVSARIRTSAKVRAKGASSARSSARAKQTRSSAGIRSKGSSFRDLSEGAVVDGEPDLKRANQGREPVTGVECQEPSAKSSFSDQSSSDTTSSRYQSNTSARWSHNNNGKYFPKRDYKSSGSPARRHKSALVSNYSTRTRRSLDSGGSSRAISARQRSRPNSTSLTDLREELRQDGSAGGMRQCHTSYRLRPRPFAMVGYNGSASPPRSPLSRQAHLSSEEDDDSIYKFDEKSIGSIKSTKPSPREIRDSLALPNFEFKSYRRERQPVVTRSITIKEERRPEETISQIDVGIGGNYRKLCASVERDIAARRRENSLLQFPRERSLSPAYGPRQRSMFEENKRRRVEFRNETPDIVQLPSDDVRPDSPQIDQKKGFDTNRLSVTTLSLGVTPSPPPRSILKRRELTPELPRRAVSPSPTPSLTLTPAASFSDEQDDVISRFPKLSPSQPVTSDVPRHDVSVTYLPPNYVPHTGYLSPTTAGSSSPKLGLRFQCSKEFAAAFERLEDALPN